jgi:CBS-domain-containing membrane protein
MILPSYSLRSILYLAIVVALVAVVAGQAVQGADWAVAVTVAVGSLVLTSVVLILFYGIVASFARIALYRESRSPRPAYYPETRRGSAATTSDLSRPSNSPQE